MADTAMRPDVVPEGVPTDAGGADHPSTAEATAAPGVPGDPAVALGVDGTVDVERSGSSVAPTTPRFDAALTRMAGRLGQALDTIGGDDDAARFLQQLAVTATSTGSTGDGSCLGLPFGTRPQPIDRLVAALAPTPMEIDLLVLGALAHHHEAVAAILRGLHPDGRPWPTVGLAGTLAELGLLAGSANAGTCVSCGMETSTQPTPIPADGQNAGATAGTCASCGTETSNQLTQIPAMGPRGGAAAVDRAAVRRVLDVGVLVRSGAIVVDGGGVGPGAGVGGEDRPFGERSIRIAPLLFEALAELGGWPTGCQLDRRPTPSWGLRSWFDDPSVRAAGAAVERHAGVAVLASGDRPEALAGRLAALVDAAGREAVVLHAPRLDGPLLATIALLALTRSVVPVVWSETIPLGPLDAADLPIPVLLAVPSAEIVAWPRHVLTVPTNPLGRTDRIDAIESAIPELGPLRNPVGPATVEPSDLAVAAGDLRARARLGRLPVHHHDLTVAVDSRTRATVPAGGVLVHPGVTWDDLVLPDHRMQQLTEAVGRAQRQHTVFDTWGFLPGRTGRGGLRLLFCGPPGTGKTLAAEVIAGELGRDLLIVDLSQLVSKWIGETEKNLDAAFVAAERGGAVLFFDEADSLFSKRTEVGDARDRYANLETAYLLSRLERFDGVVVLATNLRQNLDAAFARRIEFIVPFDQPDAAEREALWRHHLPTSAPLAPSIDFARLATLYEVPGALIRNAAVAAAFLAAAEPPGPAASAASAGSAGIGVSTGTETSTQPTQVPAGAHLTGSSAGTGVSRSTETGTQLTQVPASAAQDPAASVPGRGPTRDAVITMRHIVHAVRREYVKAGQAFPGAPSGMSA